MYILHLSDLHFGNTKDANHWHGQLSNDLGQLLTQLEPERTNCLDALIISGDIANKSLPEEYKAAALFLNRLMPDFGLRRNQVAIIPGNHDLNWELSEDAFTPIQRKKYPDALDENNIFANDLIIDGNFVLVPNSAHYEQRFSYFSGFYENIIGKPYPQPYRQQYKLQHFPEQNLLILGLNSAWKLNHDSKYRTCASINLDALTNAIREINENPTYKNSLLKIAVWHHPLNSPFEDRIKDHGFIEQLAQNGFRLALHGHIHRAGVEDYKYRAGSKVDIIAAGTFGAPVKEWVPGYPLQYNLLKWKDNKLTVYTRKRIAINGAWQPDAMWVQADGITASSFYEIELWKANQVNGERQQPAEFPQPSNRDTPIKKILILEANPQRNIDLNEEIRDLKNVIQSSRDREKFQIEVGLAVRSEDLHDLILNFEPNIVHFCGHGAGEPGLVFLDKKIGTDALANLFELFKEHLECVVLNACYSEVQADAIVKHINYVVGMKQAIRDDTAIAFSLGFYRALGYGRSIEDAYKFGCNAIQLAIEDTSTKRDVIAEEMRKLVVVEPMPSKIIPENLKPVLYCQYKRKKPVKTPVVPRREIPGYLRKHYQVLSKAIREGFIVPFLGADINLCDRQSEERDFKPSDWKKNGPYPPTNLELAAYIDRETTFIDKEGRGYVDTFRCPLISDTSLDELPSEFPPDGCPLKTGRITRLDLQRVSQYFQSRQPTPERLTDSINYIYQQSSYQFNSLHKFLVHLIKEVCPVETKKSDATPYPLIVTTCFDRTLERAFENELLEFDLVSYTSSEEKFIYQRFDCQDGGEDMRWTKGEITSEVDISDKKAPFSLIERPVILRLYGPVDWNNARKGENFAMTEDHFLDYLGLDISKKLPKKLWRKLTESSLWFLGYSLSHWNLRFIIRKIRKEIKSDHPQWWAVQEKADVLDEDLWKKSDISFFRDREIGSLEQYLKEVEEQLTNDLNRLPKPRKR